jgi:hypothetical protein
MGMSTRKIKILAFQRKEPIQDNVCIDNGILGRVNKVTYFGYMLSSQEVDISNKIAKYTKAMGVINNVLEPSLGHRHTSLPLVKLRPN